MRLATSLPFVPSYLPCLLPLVHCLPHVIGFPFRKIVVYAVVPSPTEWGTGEGVALF